jgi:hypothetical protein
LPRGLPRRAHRKFAWCKLLLISSPPSSPVGLAGQGPRVCLRIDWVVPKQFTDSYTPRAGLSFTLLINTLGPWRGRAGRRRSVVGPVRVPDYASDIMVRCKPVGLRVRGHGAIMMSRLRQSDPLTPRGSRAESEPRWTRHNQTENPHDYFTSLSKSRLFSGEIPSPTRSHHHGIGRRSIGRRNSILNSS